MNASPESHPARPPRRRSRLTRLLWCAHVVLLALAGGFTVVSGVAGSEDANIGFGLGLLALGAMGAPWTLPLLSDQHPALDSVLVVAGLVAGSLVNLALHAALVRWWGRTARRA